MGGQLALRVAAKVRPKTLVLVCTNTPPGVGSPREPKEYPDVVRWAGGPYEETLKAMPDSDERTRHLAHSRWRDESGAVLRELATSSGVPKPECPVLVVIPEADDTVAPSRQQELAAWAGADTLRYARMSHVGPLLSTRAKEVAGSVLAWVRARLAELGKAGGLGMARPPSGV